MAMQLASRRVALAVGIIVVAVGTVAVISVVKQRGEAARHNEITKVADERLKEMESEGAPLTQDKSKKEGSGETTREEGRQEQAPKEQEGVASDDAVASEMPQTGVGSLFALLPVGMVAFAVTAYFQSRRQLL